MYVILWLRAIIKTKRKTKASWIFVIVIVNHKHTDELAGFGYQGQNQDGRFLFCSWGQASWACVCI
jgi:uncharacterized membrane protein